MLTSILQKP